MTTHYHSAQRPSSPHHNVDEQLLQWQTPKRLGEVSRVMPQKAFTQVTIAAYQRANSCHGDLGITHHNSDTERQRGDLTRNSTCNENPPGTQYKSLRTLSCYSQAESINQNQCSPPMLCTTSSYVSSPDENEPYWTGYSAASQNPSAVEGGACYSPIDCSSPYVAVRLPPTPADTVQADEGPRKNSLNNGGSPTTSPLRYKSETGSHGPVSRINATFFRSAEQALEEQQESKTLLTPPPEQAVCSTERTTQVFYERLQATFEDTEFKPGEDAEMKGNGKRYTDSSATPVVGEDPDLDFLSSNWDPNNFDFLDDESGFASTFTSNQETNWDVRQNILPPAYPSLAFDSCYSTDVEGGLATFQSHSTFAPDRPPDYHFDQLGSYLQAPSNSTGLDTFHDSFPTFETHTFSVQQTSTSQGNDRTSHRSKSKDQMLVDLKQRGYSYKDIKVMGQFEEAESTLRGRYRTLTKPKEARVRKPEWGDREVHLLMQAVTAHTNASNDYQPSSIRGASTTSRRANKIPWKQVAEYMALRGAYRYGNATVKKKWTEVMRANEGR